MGKKLREALLLEAKKKDNGNGNGKNGKKKGKMLNKLHELDDNIEDFVDGLEDEIMKVDDNPMFVKKAQQLLADMSKEYSEFIMALRAIVNAVDRKGQILPAFENPESKVRDVRDGAGDQPPPQDEEEAPPPEEEEEGQDEFVIAKKDKKDKKDKKKSPVKEALER